MLFGGDAGQRLEPVRVVTRAVLERPLHERRGHRVGDGGIEGLSVDDGLAKCGIRGLRQPRFLRLVVESQGAKHLGGLGKASGFRVEKVPSR